MATAPAGTAVVDVDSFIARAFGSDVAASVNSFRAASRSASFIRSWSSVRSLPFATCNQPCASSGKNQMTTNLPDGECAVVLVLRDRVAAQRQVFEMC
jgi:hypothetical protein